MSTGVAVNFVDVDVPEEGEFVSGSDLEEFLAWRSLKNQGKVEGLLTENPQFC